jgi:hypothetical protein
VRLRSAIESAIQKSQIGFNPGIDDLLTIARHTSQITFGLDADGGLTATKGGQPIDPQSALKKLAVEQPYVANKTSAGWKALEMNGPDQEGLIKSRADFHSVEQRSAWISAHGLQPYEQLPSRRFAAGDVASMSASEYRQLSPAQKAAVIAEVGESGLQVVLRRRG